MVDEIKAYYYYSVTTFCPGGLSELIYAKIIIKHIIPSREENRRWQEVLLQCTLMLEMAKLAKTKLTSSRLYEEVLDLPLLDENVI